MLRLILMRHAKSDWSHPGTGDHDRPLNARGRTSAIALGDWLRTHGFMPHAVLCSSATRTRQTIAGLGLPKSTPVEFTRRLYLAGADDMMDVLRGASAASVLMLGHNGGIGDMASRLLDAAPDHHHFDDYPTGATLVADFDIDSWAEVKWHMGKARAFVVPRDLLGG